ncbi:hypothetical protein EON65_19920 [archaeon]|nr:MAG: hypothetical protein EON65_19920 [archaeon]
MKGNRNAVFVFFEHNFRLSELKVTIDNILRDFTRKMDVAAIIQRLFQHSMVAPGDLRRLQQSIDEKKSRDDVLNALQEFVGKVTQVEIYSYLCELLKLLVHACRYDMTQLLKVYDVGCQLVLDLGGVTISARHSLNGLVAWSNLPFWIDTTLQLAETDSKVIDLLVCELTAVGKQATDYTLGMATSQLKETATVLRIHSVSSAMKTLKLSKEIIESYVKTMSSQLRIKDVASSKRKEAYLGHVEALHSLLLQHYSIHADINKGQYYLPEVHSNQLSYILAESTIPCMGQSDFLSLLYSCALMPIRQYKSQANMNKRSANISFRCICGQSIEKWRLLGLPSDEESVILRKLGAANLLQDQTILSHSNAWHNLTNIICESCYRSVQQEMSADGDCVDVGASPFFSKLTSSFSSLKSNSIDEHEAHNAQAVETMPVLSPPKPSHHVHRVEVEDEVSVVSGISRVDINDDDSSVMSRSDQHKVQHNDIPRLSESEFFVFMCSLWTGIPITLVYSYDPIVEKTRLLFLCSSDPGVNEVLRSRLTRTSRSEGLDSQFYVWLASKASTLHIGWAHLSEQKSLQYNAKKSLSLVEIKNIKVGSKRWKNCVKIGSTSVVIVIKVDHDEQFSILLKGLTQLIANISASGHK